VGNDGEVEDGGGEEGSVVLDVGSLDHLGMECDGHGGDHNGDARDEVGSSKRPYLLLIMLIL